jgi:broad specificity phosphatase PhoE
MPIYLARHGETPLSGTFCGSSNPALTRRGRAQARAAGRILSRFPIDRCYASPLLRARQTAQLIQRRLKIPVVTGIALRELRFGAWEGLRFGEIEKKWPALAKRWTIDPIKVRIPRAESFAALRRRIKRFLASIHQENVLIVAHGGSLSAIILELLSLPDRKFPKHILPTGSVCRIHQQRIETLC